MLLSTNAGVFEKVNECGLGRILGSSKAWAQAHMLYKSALRGRTLDDRIGLGQKLLAVVAV